MAPGFIETRLTATNQDGEDIGIPEQVRQMALMLIALQRYGEPEDVANAHLFLASEEADYISGVVLPVSGGQLGA
jgi:3-oxoacyl-[acyl-carrier protein] reductase